jgi:NodT family efflux transporter outer membrane factor (OMF) lipoprotein
MTMKNRLSASALAALLLIAGCKEPLPPPPIAPAPSVSGYGALPPQTAAADVPGGAAQRFLVDMDVPGQWWTLFHSAQLNALIDQGVKANPDVAAAQAALRSARETLEAQRSSAYPVAQGSYSVTRQQVPAYLGAPLNNPNTYAYSVHTLSLDVAYTPDVFGNLRYQRAASAAALDAQRFQVEATYLTLTANIAVAAVAQASLRGQIDATHRIVDLEQRLLDLTKTQHSYAQASGLDVLTQEAALRAAEQALPPLQKQLAQLDDQLARLLGRAPGDASGAVFDLAELHLPQDLPVSLPSRLIVQRPDIAIASANLAEASAEAGVAYTDRLPDFSITAQAATQALSAGGLFGAGSLLSMLTAQVSSTFYDHGALKHRQAAQVAAYDQAAAEYQGAVLSGLQNVADSLAALKSDADALNAAAQSGHVAQRALDIARAQDKAGEASLPAVLDAEQLYEQAELALLAAQANRYMDTIALFEALGGGWWNRGETSPGA